MARSIEEQLRDFCVSDKGKVYIKQKIKSSGSINRVADQNINFALSEAADMRRLLVRYFNDAGLTSISENQISFSPVYTDQDGVIRIDLTMDNADLRRPSLYPDGYPDGAYNIVTLFIRGWDSSPVYGLWESRGISVKGRTHKSPDPMIQNAIKEFERTHTSKAIARME